MRTSRPRSVSGILAALVVLLAVASCDAPTATDPVVEPPLPPKPSYSLDPTAITVHPLPDGGVFSVAWALNDAGWAAGYLHTSAPHIAVVWIPEGEGPDSYRMRDLSALAGGYPGIAWDVNNHNEVAGYMTLQDGVTRVFVWSEAMGFIFLEPALPSLYYPVALNDHRQVVSYPRALWTVHDDGAYEHTSLPDGAFVPYDITRSGVVVGGGSGGAFRWSAEDGLTWLGDNYSYAFAAGECGPIAGYSHNQAAAWTEVGESRLSTPAPDHRYSFVYGVADGGWITGVAGDMENDALLWTDVDAEPIVLPHLGIRYSVGLDVNQTGLATGVSLIEGTRYNAVIWDLGGRPPPCGPETTEEWIEYTEELIDQLLDAGDLTGGQANALTTKLERALDSLARGNERAATNQIGAFINQVEALVRSGRITAEEGDALIAAAQEALAAMGG